MKPRPRGGPIGFLSNGWTLDNWAATRVGGGLTREKLESYQLRAIQEILSYVKGRSSFHARRLEGSRVETLKDIASLPFMDARSLTEDPLAALCEPLGNIARVATFNSQTREAWGQSSGTSGDPKRIFFTSGDMENTRVFFANGMRHIPGSRTLICIGNPAAPASVGSLLAEALSRLGRAGMAEGFLSSPEKTIEKIRALGVDSLVGVPCQMLALARHPAARKARVPLRSILLSGDYASEGLAGALRDAFGCAVFRHYGMAETGYGAAVECALHQGMHIRETELLFEIVESGGRRILPDGEWGEAVVTTLSQRGVPMMRYRTGDLGRFLPGACPCGSALKRLEIRGRLGDVLRLPEGPVRLCELDDVLHPLPWLTDFGVAIDKHFSHPRLTFHCAEPPPDGWRSEARKSLGLIPPLRNALSEGRVEFVLSQRPFSSGSGKKFLKIEETLPAFFNYETCTEKEKMTQ
jgi:phenylacetate-coenzyme A ligase PaaK-like adenylate-forming protein